MVFGVHSEIEQAKFIHIKNKLHLVHGHVIYKDDIIVDEKHSSNHKRNLGKF